jgi:hypothetical protein
MITYVFFNLKRVNVCEHMVDSTTSQFWNSFFYYFCVFLTLVLSCLRGLIRIKGFYVLYCRTMRKCWVWWLPCWVRWCTRWTDLAPCDLGCRNLQTTLSRGTEGSRSTVLLTQHPASSFYEICSRSSISSTHRSISRLLR